MDTLAALCDILDCTPNDLIELEVVNARSARPPATQTDRAVGAAQHDPATDLRVSTPKRRNRNRYPGDPTGTAQQRLIGRLVAAIGPELTRDVAQDALQKAKAWTFIPMRELDQHLDAFPDALSDPDPHAPRSLARIAHRLIDAGFAAVVTPPRCIACGQAKPTLGEDSQPHPDGIGRCCGACMIRLTEKRCTRCGELGAGTARRGDGVICRRCYRHDPDRQQTCDGCGLQREPGGRTRDGAPLCHGCLPKVAYPCTRCGVVAPTHAITETGRVCNRCYEQPQRVCGHCGSVRRITRRAHGDDPDTCERCWRRPRARLRARSRPSPEVTRRRLQAFEQAEIDERAQALAQAKADQRAEARAAAQRMKAERAEARAAARRARPPGVRRPPRRYRTAEDYTCSSCGATGFNYAAGRCERCVATDRVTDLLSDANGAISAQLLPFADFLLTTTSPRRLLRWMFRSSGAGILAQLANSPVAIEHHVLDELPDIPQLRYLRQLLVAGGVLPLTL